MPKKWYTSKTIWVGIITTLLATITFIETNQGASIATICSGILMILLRTLTSQPVK